MLITEYRNFFVTRAAFKCGEPAWVASFMFDRDISRIFPYINAVAENPIYLNNPIYIQFTHKGFRCALYSDHGLAQFFNGQEQALAFLKDLIGFLNNLYEELDKIRPNHKTYKNLPILEIFRLLPGTNCRKCGFNTCMAFAMAVSKREILPGKCPDIVEPIERYVVYPIYDEKGEIISTVEFEMDPSRTDPSNQRDEQYIQSLERSLADISKERSESFLNGDNHGIRCRLTAREVEVLRLIAEGFTNAEISQILSVTPHTVKSHVVHIFNKLGVNDRTQAAVWAVRHRLI